MNKLLPATLLSILFSTTTPALADIVTVNCTAFAPGSVSAALAASTGPTTLVLSGTCNDSVSIDRDDITITGDAVITGFFPQDRITIDGAQRAVLSGVTIESGIMGVHATNNASFSMTNVTLTKNVHGLIVDNGAAVTLNNDNWIKGNFVFGFQALNGAKMHVTKASGVAGTTHIANNFLGGQVSVNSSLFVTDGAKVDVHNNHSIGLSINTGSTGMLFNSDLHTFDNALDGLDVVSNSNFEVDGESEVISERNGRDGISIDNGAINLFGFFSSASGEPRIQANNNAGNGVNVESTSKLDIGRNASIQANDNKAAGVKLDDGSSAILQRADINNNVGKLDMSGNGDSRFESGEAKTGDVVLSFGSRISFNTEPDNAGVVTPNNVGTALCDRSSLSRGDVRCVD